MYKITNDRLMHILAVARQMREKATQLGWGGKKAQEMFVLGLNHDLGYEFGENTNHNMIGGKILKDTGFKYYKEVMYHGVNNCEYQSEELDLMNWADMHTDGKGNRVSFDERLADIANRRGKDSSAYIESKKMCDSIVSKGLENKEPTL